MSLQVYSKLPFLYKINTLADGNCMYSAFFRMCKIYKISLANTYFSECNIYIETDAEMFFIECVREKLAQFVLYSRDQIVKNIFDNTKDVMLAIHNTETNTFGYNNRQIKDVLKNPDDRFRFLLFKTELADKIRKLRTYATDIEYSLLHHILPDIINERVLTGNVNNDSDYDRLRLDENKLIFFSKGIHYTGMITIKKLNKVYGPRPSKSTHKPVASSTPRNRLSAISGQRNGSAAMIAPTIKHSSASTSLPKPQTFSRSHITTKSNSNSSSNNTIKGNKGSAKRKNNSPKPELPPRSYRITFGLNRQNRNK